MKRIQKFVGDDIYAGLIDCYKKLLAEGIRVRFSISRHWFMDALENGLRAINVPTDKTDLSH